MLEAGIVLQHHVADKLFRLTVGTEIITVDRAAYPRGGVGDIDIAKVIGQFAVTQVAAQHETVVEVVGYQTGHAGPFNVVIVEAWLAVEIAAIVFTVQWVTTTVWCAVAVKVIENQRGRCKSRGLPGQAAQNEAIVVCGIVVFALAVLHLADESVGQCLAFIQCPTRIQPSLDMLERTIGDEALTETIKTRLLADKVHRTTRIGRSEQS